MAIILALLFFITAGNVYPGGGKQQAPVIQTSQNPTQIKNDNKEQSAPSSNSNTTANTRAEIVTKALATAYPQRISKAEFKDGDWAVLIYDTWYYYENGKFLPAELRASADNYSPQTFYNYPAELPPWKAPSSEEAARYREMVKNRNRDSVKRSTLFLDDLWRAHNKDESFQRIKSIRFLGHSVMVHYSILSELSLVEDKILTLAKTNPHIQTWIKNIDSATAWNWRNIADTQSRSFHSYGAAIDILPKSLGGKETYWLWAARKRPEWWNVSYNERYHPPVEVIQAFESYGFIWGGKWLFYDTMHFEYRPEILLLSGIEINNIR